MAPGNGAGVGPPDTDHPRKFEHLGQRLDKNNNTTGDNVVGVCRRAVTHVLPRERLAHLARQVHRLGERPLFELFAELKAGAPLDQTLERYARLWPLADFIRDLGGDRLPLLRPLEGGREDDEVAR